MSAGWPGRPEEPRPEVPLGRLDPTLIHRARAINTDALRVIDDLLDQIVDRRRS